eukprot:scaffold977_cov128-Cylindrotheca_fusiformis.AAC.2
MFDTKRVYEKVSKSPLPRTIVGRDRNTYSFKGLASSKILVGSMTKSGPDKAGKLAKTFIVNGKDIIRSKRVYGKMSFGGVKLKGAEEFIWVCNMLEARDSRSSATATTYEDYLATTGSST